MKETVVDIKEEHKLGINNIKMHRQSIMDQQKIP